MTTKRRRRGRKEPLLRRIARRLPWAGAGDDADAVARSYVDSLRREMALLRAELAEGGHFAKDLQAPFLAFLGHFAPLRVVGFPKRRFGGPGDGGYVMIDDLDGVTAAISGGIGNDVSWDRAMADRGITVHQADHTVAAPPSEHPLFRFHRKRLADPPLGPDDTTLGALVGLCGGDGDTIACKLDIEGSEWDVLASAAPADLARCRQIVVEFHDMQRFAEPDWRRRATAGLERLAETHQCVHVHGNNARLFAVIGGVPFPSVIEATFVRRARYRFVAEPDSFPTPLDAPNFSHRADLYLGPLDHLRPVDR